MKDSGGTEWRTVRLSEHDRDALAVARRLVMRELCGKPDAVEPQAVAINLDRMIEDWDSATDES